MNDRHGDNDDMKWIRGNVVIFDTSVKTWINSYSGSHVMSNIHRYCRSKYDSNVIIEVNDNTLLDKNTSDVINSVTILNSTTPAWQRIDPFFGIWMSMGFDTFIFGSILLVIYLFVPGVITERETSYPKRIFIVSGGCQAMSAVFYQFSTSGTRTPPYLQGALGYFAIPLTFSLRYLILHKRPTRRKLLCVVVIMLGEMVCLLPTVFPGLESATTHRQEGGAMGVGRILWPLVFILQMIPHSLWNILLEKGAKDRAASGEDLDQKRLNIIFVMFWNFFGTFSTAILLFALDLIPGFGLMASIEMFPYQAWFNIRCIFGAADVCQWYQIFTAWGRMIFKTSFFFLVGLLVRYGEGANYYAILGAIITPGVFIIFAIFDEQALRYNPHLTLSTWLSVGALAVMLPTVILYSTGPPEITIETSKPSTETQEPLLDNDEETFSHAQENNSFSINA